MLPPCFDDTDKADEKNDHEDDESGKSPAALTEEVENVEHCRSSFAVRSLLVSLASMAGDGGGRDHLLGGLSSKPFMA